MNRDNIKCFGSTFLRRNKSLPLLASSILGSSLSRSKPSCWCPKKRDGQEWVIQFPLSPSLIYVVVVRIKSYGYVVSYRKANNTALLNHQIQSRGHHERHKFDWYTTAHFLRGMGTRHANCVPVFRTNVNLNTDWAQVPLGVAKKQLLHAQIPYSVQFGLPHTLRGCSGNEEYHGANPSS